MSEHEVKNKKIILTPDTGWSKQVLQELWDYRDLFYFLVWRNIKVLYAQTILGFMWAILNPAIQIAIFTLIFGKIAKIPTDDIPYLLFVTVAIIPWTYMSEAMVASSQSLVTDQSILGKVYFPRLIYPSTPVLAKLVDFSISLLIIVPIMFYYSIAPTWNLLLLPLFVLLMMSVPLGVGLWLSALAIRYRDVKFAMSFGIRMLMYTAPIIYSSSSIPETYRLLYSLNPLVAVIEGFRSCLLGVAYEWQYIIPGAIVAVLILISGAFYFKRVERVFVDVI
jgi:lipopolysaccharide transport system permease protein